MPDHATDRYPLWEVQNIYKVVPSRIQIQRILIGLKGQRMVAVLLVHRSSFYIAITKCSDSALDPNHSIVGSERPLAESHVEAERPDGEPLIRGARPPR